MAAAGGFSSVMIVVIVELVIDLGFTDI
jgi:hypothetical protein